MIPKWTTLHDQDLITRYLGTPRFNVIRMQLGDEAEYSDFYGVTLFGAVFTVCA